MSDLLPVLVADLLEESARDFLEGVARENEEAWVPLVSAPVDASPHLLEIYTPGSPEPLRLIAEPTGPPTEHGFPLRLSMPDDQPDDSLRVPTVEEVAVNFEISIEGAPDPTTTARSINQGSCPPSPSPPSPSSSNQGTRREEGGGGRGPVAAGTARRPTPIHLSVEHGAELGGEAVPTSAASRDALIGRTL
ncbi:MAG TPA: hypothetical protein VLT33_32015, partial [Labilithrix sp.]|nr:hypothetical protein [Labilithrix sp.]